MAVINDFSTNYMKALGLNQAYITAINKEFIRLFFLWITQMFSIDTKNDMDTENNFENNNILLF